MRIRIRHRGFTLVEMLVSLSVMGLLMTGLATAVLLAAQAVPEENSPLQQGLNAAMAIDQLNDELTFAIALTVQTPNTIEFTVPDRDILVLRGAETIRYEWSGVAGEALTRSYNGGPKANVARDVREFSITYHIQSVSRTTTQTTEQETPELTLASFDGWPGLIGASQEYPLSSSEHVSQFFQVFPPAGATKLTFTKARLMMRRPLLLLPSASFRVSLHRPKGVGGMEPASASLAPPTIVPGSDVPLVLGWTLVDFADFSVMDLDRTDFCLTASGVSSDAAWAEALYNKFATNNGAVLLWSTNGGATWQPTSSLDQRDLRFYVYGIFTVSTTTNVTTTHYELRTVEVRLRCGGEASSVVQTSAELLNRPEVTGL